MVALATNAEGTYYEGGFGERIQGDGVDTVVWLASMTKAITGAAAMQLVADPKSLPLAESLESLVYQNVWQGLYRPRWARNCCLRFSGGTTFITPTGDHKALRNA